MSEFGTLDLISSSISADNAYAIAKTAAPGVVFVANRPKADRTVRRLLTHLRRLPEEVVVVEVERLNTQHWTVEHMSPHTYLGESVIPLLLRGQNVLVVAPSKLISAISNEIDPVHRVLISTATRVLYSFDRPFPFRTIRTEPERHPLDIE